jgi:hypothetical protein
MVMVLHEANRGSDISTSPFSDDSLSPIFIESLLETIQQTPYDRDSIPQENLDLANKFRTSLFPWRGQFSPELVEILLSRYSQPSFSILDPFVGSGTTIFESARKGLKCYGVEINPSAIEMTKAALFAHMKQAEKQKLIHSSITLAEKYFFSPDLFSFQNIDHQRDVSSLHLTVEDALKELIHETEKDPYLHNIIINALIRYMNYKPPRTKSDFMRALQEHVKIIESIPYSPAECKIFHTDARRIPLPDNCIDLVITSPPYINVFNYHQNNRTTMEFLGWDLLEIAKSEIGSNRKNRQNRFLTVIQYALDMLDVLHEIRRLLCSEGRAIIVIGRESSVRRVSFDNGTLVALLALGGAGFDLAARQERKFINKFGDTIYEDILHLIPNSRVSMRDDSFARNVATWYLHKKINVNHTPTNNEISEALASVHLVQKSPVFYLSSAYNDDAEPTQESAKELEMPRRNKKQVVALENIGVVSKPYPTPHLEKLKAALESDKLPPDDIPQIEKTINHYKEWISGLDALMESDLPIDQKLPKMVDSLNQYRIRMDIDLIFDSQHNWLYRQKGQLKLDNSIIEEFLPRLVSICLKSEISQLNATIGPIKAFSAIWFNSNLLRPERGGGLNIRTKDQDFAISRPLYIKASNTPDFSQAATIEKSTNLAYAATECKTNLDKTMFQEACATAGDLKSAIPGARYFLLCEWLDMPPISSSITPIDRTFVLRREKRLNSNIRGKFDTVEGRRELRDFYVDFLHKYPLRVHVFEMFIESIQKLLQDESLDEETVLEKGFF